MTATSSWRSWRATHKAVLTSLQVGGTERGQRAPADTRHAIDMQRPAESVSLVVVTYNSAAVLRDFFASLPEGLRGVLHYEVIVVDNASTDASPSLVSDLWPDAVILRLDRNYGYAAAVNLGIEAAHLDGPVYVLNPDVRLRPGSVELLLRALSKDGVGIVAPRLTDRDGNLAHSLRREPSVSRAFGEALLGGTRSGRFSMLGEVVRRPEAYEKLACFDWASGCALMISRTCLETVGVWDETFFLYAEETEYCLRSRDAGFALVYVPDAVAVHLGGESHENPHLWSMLVVNRLRLFARRHGRLRTACFWLALTTNEALRALLGRKPARRALAALLFPWTRPPEVR